MKLIPFDTPIDRSLLDLSIKNSKNFFSYKGQFPPLLVNNLIDSYYCGGTLLDPFCGSGTVLYEASKWSIPVIGIDVNISAYLMSRLFILMSYSKTDREFFIREAFEEAKRDKIAYESKIIWEAFFVSKSFHKSLDSSYFSEAILSFPLVTSSLDVYHTDARIIPLKNNSVDFIITSPPYINVLNYHQYLRREVELLGYDVLSLAYSEIGSNRANRQNRFITVIQYCIDIEDVLKELYRVCKKDSRLLFIIGKESRVSGVPFYNSDIFSQLAVRSGYFNILLKQERKFKNRFGNVIYEDILHMTPNFGNKTSIAKTVSKELLIDSKNFVSEKHKTLLEMALASIDHIKGTRVLCQK